MARSLPNDIQLATGVHVSNQIVRNRFHSDSLHIRRPAPGPILTVAHHTDRQIFCQEPHRMAMGPAAHSTVYGRKLFPCVHL